MVKKPENGDGQRKLNRISFITTLGAFLWVLRVVYLGIYKYLFLQYNLRNMEEKNKSEELKRLLEIVLATLDYAILRMKELKKKDEKYRNSEFDFVAHFVELKKEAKVIFEKGQLAKLKRWCHDIMEPYFDDEKFPDYIKKKTGHYIFPIEELQKRIDKIIKRKKIRNGHEYRDVKEMIDVLNVKADRKQWQFLCEMLDEFDKD